MPSSQPSAEHWCRAERLYQMKCMFLERGEYTTQQLAEMFGVTVDTIVRDLTVLQTRLRVPLVRSVQVIVRWRLMDSG